VRRTGVLVAISAIALVLAATGTAVMAQPDRATAFASRREPGLVQTHSARVDSRPEVYLLRGLLNVFSLGMDELAAKLRSQGFSATVYSHTAWPTIADHIIASRAAGSKRPIVLIGHSLGGDDVIKLADRLKGAGIWVDLLIPVDPVSPAAVPANVRRVVNYYQSNNGWGQPVRAGPGFRGALVNADLESSRRDLRDVDTGHTTIDKGEKVHRDILRQLVTVRKAHGALR
jgi:pimeloyl-ACP methyl ester carboxylesterase